MFEMDIYKAIYQANNLPYHNWDHIKRMQAFLPGVYKNHKHFNELLWAIAAHDLVYVPGAKDNEELSSGLFTDIHQNYDMAIDYSLIHALIMSTKNHEVADSVKYKELYDVIIDLDLMGLGDPWKQYMETGEKIRQEFKAFTDDEFMAGRIKFLEKYGMKKEPIFKTPFFSHLEARARQNLMQEKYIIEKFNRLPPYFSFD